ncbi:MAG TPA: DUF1501 domain-containing protein [Pirellulales bacterium]|nr:DUF1501 domain-containing protein [Pirellulales bacterium]
MPRLTPCGRSRREFIWQAGGGFVGTALTYLLAQDGFLGGAQAATRTSSPVASKFPHFAPTAKSCIFLFMYGGPSQVDLFDPKPELTKRNGQAMPAVEHDPRFGADARRTTGRPLLGSLWEFKRQGQAGIEISSLFPRLGECVDDMAIIRSCHADSFAHGSGLLQMNTGSLRQGYPSLGSWVTYGLGTVNQNLPSYIVMLDHRGGPIGGAPNWGAGFMPATFQGTQFRTSGDPIIDLSPRGGMTRAQQRQQLDLLSQLNETHRQRLPAETELAARVESYELAFRMQQHAPDAVDLGQENAATLEHYGLNNPVTKKFARRVLLARRLVERGVRFVQVYSGGGHFDENWDAHQGMKKNHELHCAETDQPIAALLTDLKQRGLLDETLVVWGGEFGRTPTSQGDNKGRDHNPRGFSMWMAGGGIQGGQVYGATDDFGYAAVEKKVHVHDLHATILHLMGMRHEELTYFHGGREMRLTDVAGNVLSDLLA